MLDNMEGTTGYDIMSHGVFEQKTTVISSIYPALCLSLFISEKQASYRSGLNLTKVRDKGTD